jgi:hypothetical protein
MLINRRTAVFGACAAGVAARVANAANYYHGCNLVSMEMKKKIDQTTRRTEPAFTSPANGQIHGSGDLTFDRALAETLVKISDAFSVLPGFAFSERIQLNAFASADKSLGRDDGSVVFGNSLYREIMGRREHPEVGIVAVCAHEFAHIAQEKYNLPAVLVVNGRVKRLELHADFIAGYFAGVRKRQSFEFPAAVFATTQYSFGDNNFGDPRHHGTSEERGQAVVAGFDCAFRARESFATAMQTGVRYVEQVPF